VKIVIFRTGSLFAPDAARHSAEALRAALVANGHSVEITTIPFSGAVAALVSETIAYRLFDLRHGFDLCIAIGPFAHAMKHPNKRVWAFTLYRPFYELWGTPFGPVTSSNTNAWARAYVQAVDRAWLAEAALVCAASPTLAQAILDATQVEARPLSTPLPVVSDGRPPTYDEYIVAAGPLADTSRFPLLIESFSKTTAAARLVIMAFGQAREEREYLEYLVATRGRPEATSLEFNPTWDQVRDCIAGARACVSLPFRASIADIFCLTAGAYAKPLVTMNDCGEVARLVDGDGYCVEPDASALASALDELCGDAKAARLVGNRFAAKLNAVLPAWNDVAVTLTA
jgi:hypothetical protein